MIGEQDGGPKNRWGMLAPLCCTLFDTGLPGREPVRVLALLDTGESCCLLGRLGYGDSLLANRLGIDGLCCSSPDSSNQEDLSTLGLSVGWTWAADT